MSDDKPRTGPSLQVLKGLKGMLPSMIKGHAEGKIGGKGIKVDQVPSSVCNVCGEAFNFSSGVKEEAEITRPCPKCKVQLDDGYMALVGLLPTGKPYFLFAKSESMKDKAGQVLPINPLLLEKLKNQFEAEWQIIPLPKTDSNPVINPPEETPPTRPQ